MAEKGSNKSAKSNGASHRMGNDKLKAKRVRSWKHGQEVRAHHRTRQAEQEKANAVRRYAGQLTPWELSELTRRARREHDPAVQARAREHARKG